MDIEGYNDWFRVGKNYAGQYTPEGVNIWNMAPDLVRKVLAWKNIGNNDDMFMRGPGSALGRMNYNMDENALALMDAMRRRG